MSIQSDTTSPFYWQPIWTVDRRIASNPVSLIGTDVRLRGDTGIRCKSGWRILPLLPYREQRNRAILNEGYLVSVLLGWSIGCGDLVWTIGSRTEITNFYLDPMSAFTRTFPEAVVLATIGFVLGLVFCRLLQTAVFPVGDSGRKSRTQ